MWEGRVRGPVVLCTFLPRILFLPSHFLRFCLQCPYHTLQALPKSHSASRAKIALYKLVCLYSRLLATRRSTSSASTPRTRRTSGGPASTTSPPSHPRVLHQGLWQPPCPSQAGNHWEVGGGGVACVHVFSSRKAGPVPTGRISGTGPALSGHVTLCKVTLQLGWPIAVRWCACMQATTR